MYSRPLLQSPRNAFSASITAMLARFSSKSIAPFSPGITPQSSSSSSTLSTSFPSSSSQGFKDTGARVSYSGSSGYVNYYYSKLHKSAEYGDVDSFNQFMQQGGSVDEDANLIKFDGTIRCSLILATQNGHGKIVEAIINRWNGNIHKTDEKGWSALDHAMHKALETTEPSDKENYEQIALFLLENGATAKKYLIECKKLKALKKNNAALHEKEKQLLEDHQKNSFKISSTPKTASTDLPPPGTDPFIHRLKLKSLGSSSDKKSFSTFARSFHTSRPLSMPIDVDGKPYYSTAELNKDRLDRHRQGYEDAGGKNYDEIAKKLAELIKGASTTPNTEPSDPAKQFTEEELQAALDEGIKRAKTYVGELVVSANKSGFDAGFAAGQENHPKIEEALKALHEQNKEKMKAIENQKKQAIADATREINELKETLEKFNIEKESAIKEAVTSALCKWLSNQAIELAKAEKAGLEKGLNLQPDRLEALLKTTIQSNLEESLPKTFKQTFKAYRWRTSIFYSLAKNLGFNTEEKEESSSPKCK